MYGKVELDPDEPLVCIFFKALIGRNWTTGVLSSNNDLRNLITSKFWLKVHLEPYKDIIDTEEAERLLPTLIGIHAEPYRSEECQNLMSMQ